MAIPDNRLSTTNLPTTFLTTDALVNSRLTDWERGGADLEDSDSGLDVQDWKFGLDGNNIYAEDALGARTTIIVRANIETLSGSFDQNMRPTLAYTQAGVAKLYWFDTVANDFVETTFAGASYPRLCLDDKRELQDLANDVLLAYIRAGNLYYRQQRDRYTIERLLQANVRGRLRNIGMHRANRVQFEFS